MALDLKALFGDKESLTLEEMKAATKGMSLIDNSEGKYVDAEKFTRAEKAAKDAKAAQSEAEAKLAERVKADDADDSPAKRIERIEAQAAEDRAARKKLEGELTRKDREALVASKVTSPKLRRTLLADAEALLDDDTDFETALGKAVEADEDYQTSEDDTAGKPATFTARTGDETRGKPGESDAALKAFEQGAGVTAE